MVRQSLHSKHTLRLSNLKKACYWSRDEYEFSIIWFCCLNATEQKSPEVSITMLIMQKRVTTSGEC